MSVTQISPADNRKAEKLLKAPYTSYLSLGLTGKAVDINPFHLLLEIIHLSWYLLTLR